MKNVITLLLLTISLCCAASNKPIYPASFAHRGCWFKDNVPENSLHAVRMAKRFGYKGIECDVKYTADSVMIILHDKSLNRTLRNAADYSMIKEKTYVKDLTFEELRRDYVMASDIPDMREKVPTLEELLLECKKEDIIPMLHSNIIESFELAQKIMGDGNWIAFSGKHEIMKKARNITNGLILQSISKNTKAEDALRMLETIGQPCGISTMSTALLSKEFNSVFTTQGYEVQASIFKSPHELQAFRNGVTIQLSDFCVMPDQGLETTSEWNSTDIRLKEGDSIHKEWGKLEYGATLLNIRFKGDITVVINEHYTYRLHRTGKKEDYIGIRFHDTSPSVRIMANSNTKIKEITIRTQRPN